MKKSTVIVRQLGLKDYSAIWHDMQRFTQTRNDDTLDELWMLEHPPVFTQGQNGKSEHILQSGSIPVIKVDRGGQVTYHGPGQLVVYTLVDLKRKQWNVRQMVTLLEQSVIEALNAYHIRAYNEPKAPGIYVDKKKICSLGLRIKRGCSFHGLAINIKMDLSPFSYIHPCGYKELKMTQLSEYGHTDMNQVQERVLNYLIKNLGFTDYIFKLETWYGS